MSPYCLRGMVPVANRGTFSFPRGWVAVRCILGLLEPRRLPPSSEAGEAECPRLDPGGGPW